MVFRTSKLKYTSGTYTGYKNKAADCLSRLPFVTRKRNDNPLKDEISVEYDTD